MALPPSEPGCHASRIAGIFSAAQLMLNGRPFKSTSTIRYHVTTSSNVQISVYDVSGKQLAILLNKKQDAGTYNLEWNAGNAPHGIYFINASINGTLKQSVRVSKQ